MYTTNKDLRILQMDGQVVYLPSPGTKIPLSGLAYQCGYRIDILSDLLNVSSRHLRRMFADGLGISPKKWFRLERMVYARNLLRGGLSIKDVSKKLGFRAQKDFYNEFKEYYGLSPTDFLVQEKGRILEKLGRGHS